MVEIETLGEGWRGEATSEQTGAWHVAALAKGKYALRASSKTYGPAPDMLIEVDGMTAQRDLVVRMAYDAQLVGTVVDHDGHPVAGATVNASASVTQSSDAPTGADGRFEMLGIKAGTYDLVARIGAQASPATRVTIADDERVEVKLVTQDSSIAGIVVDAKGEPVAEARVTAAPTRDSVASFSDDTTDSHGRFDLGGLEPGEYRVTATWPDQEERRLGAGQSVSTGNRNVKIVLETPATLTGRVLLDGTPMPYYGMLLTETSSIRSSALPAAYVPQTVASRFAGSTPEPGAWCCSALVRAARPSQESRSRKASARTSVTSRCRTDYTSRDTSEIRRACMWPARP